MSLYCTSMNSMLVMERAKEVRLCRACIRTNHPCPLFQDQKSPALSWEWAPKSKASSKETTYVLPPQWLASAARQRVTSQGP